MGAIAAEHVFYGENTSGVGGDMQRRHTRPAIMVGALGDGRRSASEFAP